MQCVNRGSQGFTTRQISLLRNQYLYPRRDARILRGQLHTGPFPSSSKPFSQIWKTFSSKLALFRVPKGWDRFFPDSEKEFMKAIERIKNMKEEAKDPKGSPGSKEPGEEKSDGKKDKKSEDKEEFDPRKSAEEDLKKLEEFLKKQGWMKKDKNGGKNGKGDGPEGQEEPGSILTAPPMRMFYVFLIASVFILVALNYEGEMEAPFSTFLQSWLPDARVEKIVMTEGHKVRVSMRHSKDQPFFYIGSEEAFERRFAEACNELHLHDEDKPTLSYDPNSNVTKSVAVSLITTLAPLVGLFAIFASGMSRTMKGGGGPGGIFSVGKSNAKLFNKETQVNVKFSNVAGCDEAKVEIMEFVDFLKNPKRFQALGAKIPKGSLLVGPPGTGKTLLAKAVAGESNVPFFFVSGSDFIEIFVGVGPSRVRDLFAKARENAPCIVFIDEIDAIGRARGKGGFSGGNDERENTLNQLLVEMDGFTPSTGVVVMAGTNRPDVLDKALLRPGRFDRQIAIDLPDINAREEILKVHMKPIKVSLDVETTSKRLAALTPGFSGADLANICNEAALIAARNEKQSVEIVDFESAIDRVIGGLEKKTKVISPKEKEIVATHEAGHAIVGWFLEHTSPILKVSIVPRGNAALGFAQYLPKDQYLFTTEQIIDNLTMTLAGRAAEALIFGKISTGAQDDLQKVTEWAYSLVTKYGMSKRIGQISFREGGKSDMMVGKPYSEETAEIVDLEVRKFISEAYERAYKLLEGKKQQLEEFGKKLLQMEIMKSEDIEKILGPRPYSKPNPPLPQSPPHSNEFSTATTTKPEVGQPIVEQPEVKPPRSEQFGTPADPREQQDLKETPHPFPEKKEQPPKDEGR